MSSAAPAQRRRPRRSQSGFTLLEVMVALFVLAITMAAIITAAANYANGAGELRDKTMALWVAHNRLTEIDLQPVWPQVGTSNDDVTIGAIRWTWQARVVDTPDPSLRRVDVSVSKKNDPRRRSYVTLTEFISNAGRRLQ